MNVERLIRAVKDFEVQHGRKPCQVRVSNYSLREMLAEMKRPVDFQAPVFSDQIFGMSVVTDWNFSDDEIRADWAKEGYGPAAPLSEVCGVLRAWAKAYGTELPTDHPGMVKERAEFREMWCKVDLAISKSNLLARMFFSGDGLRRVPCPVHKGMWSGCAVNAECFTDEYPYGCMWGMNITGWLPNPEVAAAQREHFNANKEKDA
jgi:hypothetical protein